MPESAWTSWWSTVRGSSSAKRSGNRRTLLLGGTAEASEIARATSGLESWDVLLSMAGRTAHPVELPIRTRRGGFGGPEGLASFLADEGIDVVIDATHPYAARMAANAKLACDEAGVPRLKVLRPAWKPAIGDRWTEVADAAGAVEALRALAAPGTAVLLAIGRQGLFPFARAGGYRYVARMIDPPEQDYPGWTILLDRGPFDLDAERRLLGEHGIAALVTKNSGGSATSAKLVAAREAGLPVIMLARPTPPLGPTVPDARGAVEWLRGMSLAK